MSKTEKQSSEDKVLHVSVQLNLVSRNRCTAEYFFVCVDATDISTFLQDCRPGP